MARKPAPLPPRAALASPPSVPVHDPAATDRSIIAFAQSQPAITILSDHAARGTPEIALSPDYLELGSRLGAVYDIIRHRNTRCPVAIGIYGDWGSGKSSAMRWLETRLCEWNELDPADGQSLAALRGAR